MNNFVLYCRLSDPFESCHQGIQGLAYECSEICRDIGIPDIMCFDNITEQEIKEAMYVKMNKMAIEEMKKKPKVKDRLSEDPEANTYIHVMSLADTRVWIRYRGRVIAGVKANFKNSHKNCLLYTSPSPRDGLLSRMPSSA